MSPEVSALFAPVEIPEDLGACEHCGRPIERSYGRRFCSPRCYQAARRKRVKAPS